MNIFELLAIVSHIGGSIAGAGAAKGHGVLSMATGFCIGLFIGRVIYLGAIYLSAKIGRISAILGKLSSIQWFASFTAGFLIPMLSMFASISLPAYVVTRIINL